MGLAKRQNEENTSGRKLSPYERQQVRYEQVRSAFASAVPALDKVIEDDFNPLTRINVLRMDHGGFLIVIERQNETITQEMLTGGEDLYDSFIKINKKLQRSEWKTKRPWPPREGERTSN